MATVLITGGSGLVGTHLSRKLIDKGYKVAVLSRAHHKGEDIHTYTWNIEKGEIEKEALETADYIIHLAGAGIADKKWTAKRKQEIVDSRIKSSQLILSKLKERDHKPKAFITASAVGYYGAITSEKIFSENDPPANDFLGDTCRQSERSADGFRELGIRTVKIRSAIVLAKEEGMLAKLSLPVKLGVGSAIGSGKQYLPWIHIDDMCGIYIKAIEDEQMQGAYNASAPDPKTNDELTETLAHVLKKPFWFPNIPAIILKFILGEMSLLLLTGSRVSSEKIRAAGYTFLFPDLKSALEDLFYS